MNIKVVVWQEDDVWCATVPALSGCHTWAENYDDLMVMVENVYYYFNNLQVPQCFC